jgi:hypothetical protein
MWENEGGVRRRPPSLATCAEDLMFPYHSGHELRSTTCLMNDGSTKDQEKEGKGNWKKKAKKREERHIDRMRRWTRWDHQNRNMLQSGCHTTFRHIYEKGIMVQCEKEGLVGTISSVSTSKKKKNKRNARIYMQNMDLCYLQSNNSQWRKSLIT